MASGYEQKEPSTTKSPWEEHGSGRRHKSSHGHGHSHRSDHHAEDHSQPLSQASTASPLPPAASSAPAPAGVAPHAEEQVSAQKVTSTVSALRKELGAVFYTSDSKVLASLRGLSARELEAVRREYKDHYGGNLDELVEQHLKGSDLAEAQASLSGDRARSYAAALRNSHGKLGVDRDKIKGILNEINGFPEAQRQDLLSKVKSEYHTLTGKELDKELTEQLSDNNSLSGKLINGVTLGKYSRVPHKDADSHEAAALLVGDATQAEAARLDGKRGFLGIGGGTDRTALMAALRNCASASERRKLTDSYLLQSGKSPGELYLELAANQEGSEKDEAEALLNFSERGDIAAAAARIKHATDGFLGTDKEAIFHELEGPDAGPDGKKLPPEKRAERRKAVIEQFEKKYGNFDAFLKQNLSKEAFTKAEQLKESGTLSDVQKIKYAVDGHFFADKQAIKDVLRGKSPAELKTLADAYKKENNDRDLFQELPALFGKNGWLGGGRDEFELEQLLLGTPETDLERLHRAQARFDHERGGARNALSKRFMDKVSHSGQDLEDTQKKLAELSPILEQCEKEHKPPPPEVHEKLMQLTGYQEADVKLYQEAKDNAANTTAAGVGVGVTIATGGAAGLASAALYGSLAGGGASALTKLALKGKDYSSEEGQRDALETGAMALTAGAGQLERVGKGLNSMLKIGPAGGGLLKEGAKGAVLGAASGAVGSAAGEVLNQDNYVGDGTFAEKFGSHVGHAGLAGALGGGMGAGIGGTLGKTAFGRNHELLSAAFSGAGGGLGGGLSNGMTGGDAELDWLGAVSGTVMGIAGAHQNNHTHQAMRAQPQSGNHGAVLVEPRVEHRTPFTNQQPSHPSPVEHTPQPVQIDPIAAADKAAGRGKFAGYGPPPEATPTYESLPTQELHAPSAVTDEKAAPLHRPSRHDAVEAAAASSLPPPELDANQKKVQHAELHYNGTVGGGNSGYRMYSFTNKQPNGSIEEYIFRPWDRVSKAKERFRKEAAAYKLNQLLEFDNGAPVVAERMMEVEGAVHPGYLQKRSGQTIDSKYGPGPLHDMAAKQYGGQGSHEDVTRMIREDPHLRDQTEQMLLERLLYGDRDDHGLNIIVNKGADQQFRIQNIDLEHAFKGHKVPQFGVGSAQGLTGHIHQEFGEKPISPKNLQHIQSFVNQYGNDVGQQQLRALGLTPDEITAMLARANWLLNGGHMPRYVSIEEQERIARAKKQR